MKKLFAIILMAVMVFTMAFSAAAAPGAFIDSPSFNKAPIIIEYYNSDGECQGVVYVTAYGDRNVLELVERENLEKAYESIRNTTTITALVPDLVDIAEKLNVSPDNLAVSDLFNLSLKDCFNHDEHGYFSIKLQPETVKNFVGLMYFADGEWHVIEDTKIEGDCLIFTTDVPRAMAIVVDVDNSIIDVPVTGDIFSWILVGVMAAAVAGVVVTVIVYKKKSRA